ncbi:DUF5631 domain-containing protein [Mycolicibacter sp. MYC123]|uniref:DUF5631 domain-containing protein n=1 Tax=[Mycobacterium] zoologicum TaxID=2872311 RepID=A0ABU5YQQ2_9MYCO|nr:DUF5631 domain-containing protein [Mycolicibacter sp. MYC123]MEB3051053.1 DUF5631 domain-containing protein [Mycolicibacter sp. MYC123]
MAVASHQPNTYIAGADPLDPIPGTGERARHGQRVDQLGPTLIDTVGANSRLPRIVQTVAQAVSRRYGAADNEIELFQQVVTATRTRVLSAYPAHAPKDVADWRLALDPEYRDAAQNLALTYETLVAVSTGKTADDPQMRSTADDVNAKDSVLKTLCGN